MKIEWVWRYELMDDPVEGETVPVVRVEALRAFLKDIDYADLEYETLREQARQLLATLKEQP